MKTESIDVALPDDNIKAGTVKNMFGRIAARYDLMNRLMTFGRDRAWHREVVRKAALPVGGRLLDIGSGTGGIVCAALDRDVTLSAVAADFTFEMMAAGRAQHTSRPIQWCGADALRLPFKDNRPLKNRFGCCDPVATSSALTHRPPRQASCSRLSMPICKLSSPWPGD